MLIKITEKCSMGCTHCLSDCKPTGQHMSMETLVDVIRFCNEEIDIFTPLIAGGEPGEHPQFVEMCLMFIESVSKQPLKFASILTNGSWIEEDENKAKSLLDYAKSKGVQLTIQITSDPRYYPRKVNIPKKIARHKDVFIDKCPTLNPQGRALNLSNDKDFFTTGAPSCCNARLVARQDIVKGMSFAEYITTLRKAGKMCIPSIDIDGSIKAGESRLCPAVGTIYDNPKDILKGIAKLECRNCTMAFEKFKEKHGDAYQMFEMLGQIVKVM